MRGVTRFWRHIWPAVPADVRDDLALLRYTNLRWQIPLLYMTTTSVVIVASAAADPAASYWVRYILPGLIVVACLSRYLWWKLNGIDNPAPDEARRKIIQTAIFASLICGLASIWTVTSWYQSIPGQRIYYPIFMVIGSLAAAFCMSSVRFVTSTLLLVGIGPSLIALVLHGNSMDRLAAGIIMLGALFLARMIQQHHDQLVNLLRLQREMRELAATDPLTGLPNRRAMKSDFTAAVEGGRSVQLALVDLDNFKPVNDAYGHAAGDKLLIAIADKLRSVQERPSGDGRMLSAYRLGGDEFALMLVGANMAELQSRLVGLLASLALPQQVGSRRIKVGASVGTAEAREGESLSDLIARADARLYAAKGHRPKRGAGSKLASRAAA